MYSVKTLAGLLIMLFAASCVTTRDEIKSFKEAGECRMAESLIKKEYSDQQQRYNLAMLYIECDGEKAKGLKILKNLAVGEYMPAMARLIEFDAASSKMIKRYKIVQCRNQTNSQFYSRNQKISSIARRWTLTGAKYGSGGMGRAGTQAEIWSDIERSKLTVWQNSEMNRCNIASAGSRSSTQTMPPSFYEIGKPPNTSNSSSATSNSQIEIDNSCIQDGGTQMCYDRQSQRYGNN
jgi:hypothetical protein